MDRKGRRVPAHGLLLSCGGDCVAAATTVTARNGCPQWVPATGDRTALRAKACTSPRTVHAPTAAVGPSPRPPHPRGGGVLPLSMGASHGRIAVGIVVAVPEDNPCSSASASWPTSTRSASSAMSSASATTLGLGRRQPDAVLRLLCRAGAGCAADDEDCASAPAPRSAARASRRCTSAAMTTLNRLAPGRVFLGIGTGNTAMRSMGQRPMRIAAFDDLSARAGRRCCAARSWTTYSTAARHARSRMLLQASAAQPDSRKSRCMSRALVRARWRWPACMATGWCSPSRRAACRWPRRWPCPPGRGARRPRALRRISIPAR